MGPLVLPSFSISVCHPLAIWTLTRQQDEFRGHPAGMLSPNIA